jgi:glycosyltransferase involved in cell wall biosynthesis
MQGALVDRGIPPDKILLWPHAADFRQLNQFTRESARQQLGIAEFFVVLYAGSFSRYYNVPFITEAAAVLEARHPSILFLLVGDGPDRSAVQKMIQDRRLQNIWLLEPVPPKKVGLFLQAADVFLAPKFVLDAPQARFLIDSPTTKLCEYLAIGRPIIAIENIDSSGPLLQRIRAGIQIRPHHPKCLASALVDFARDREKCVRYGEAGRQYALQHLSRIDITRNFVDQLRGRLPDRCG